MVINTYTSIFTTGYHTEIDKNNKRIIKQDGFISSIQLFFFLVAFGASLSFSHWMTIKTQSVPISRFTVEVVLAGFMLIAIIVMLVLWRADCASHLHKLLPQRISSGFYESGEVTGQFMKWFQKKIPVLGIVLFYVLGSPLDLVRIIAHGDCLNTFYKCDVVIFRRYIMSIIYHAVRLSFMGVQMIFCYMFHDRVLLRCSAVRYCFILIISASIVVWFDSCLFDANGLFNDLDIYLNMQWLKNHNTTNLTMDDIQCLNETTEIYNSSNSIMPYLYPLNIEFLLLVTEVLMHLYLTAEVASVFSADNNPVQWGLGSHVTSTFGGTTPSDSGTNLSSGPRTSLSPESHQLASFPRQTSNEVNSPIDQNNYDRPSTSGDPHVPYNADHQETCLTNQVSEPFSENCTQDKDRDLYKKHHKHSVGTLSLQVPEEITRGTDMKFGADKPIYASSEGRKGKGKGKGKKTHPLGVSVPTTIIKEGYGAVTVSEQTVHRSYSSEPSTEEEMILLINSQIDLIDFAGGYYVQDQDTISSRGPCFFFFALLLNIILVIFGGLTFQEHKSKIWFECYVVMKIIYWIPLILLTIKGFHVTRRYQSIFDNFDSLEMMVTISEFGFAVYCFLTLESAISCLLGSTSNDAESEKNFFFPQPALTVVDTSLNIIQILLQTNLLMHASRIRQSLMEDGQSLGDGDQEANTRRNSHKWLVNILMYMALSNFFLWALDSFVEIKNIDVGPVQKYYYGPEQWELVTHLTMPLSLFFRFNSAIIFSKICLEHNSIELK